MTEVLRQLFRCERYAATYPHGMTVAACLRRQLERQRSAKPSQVGPPAKPFCAEECPTGRAHRAACAGLASGACPSCGAALIETTRCTTCEAAREERSREPARGHLPVKRVPESVRLWTGEVPDVPIAPLSAVPARLPPAPTYTLRPAAAARAEEPLFDDPGEEDDEPSTPHQPATPAQQHQETMMPPKTEKPRQGCEHCGNRTIHKATCPKRAAKKTPPPPRPRLTAPARASVTVRALPQVEDLPDEYLLACVAEREARVERIQREAQERVARLTGKAA